MWRTAFFVGGFDSPDAAQIRVGNEVRQSAAGQDADSQVGREKEVKRQHAKYVDAFFT